MIPLLWGVSQMNPWAAIQTHKILQVISDTGNSSKDKTIQWLAKNYCDLFWFIYSQTMSIYLCASYPGSCFQIKHVILHPKTSQPLPRRWVQAHKILMSPKTIWSAVLNLELPYNLVSLDDSLCLSPANRAPATVRQGAPSKPPKLVQKSPVRHGAPSSWTSWVPLDAAPMEKSEAISDISGNQDQLCVI